MTRMVLLLHELPDGSSHYDWMIERPTPTPTPTPHPPPRAHPDPTPAPKPGLLTFRTLHRPDLTPGQPAPPARAPADMFHVEHLPDHRPEYLDYEGPVAGNRGRVRRLARGVVTALHTCACDRIELTGYWLADDGSPREAAAWAALPVGKRWWVQRVALQAAEPS
jgi:hypothetical protein